MKEPLFNDNIPTEEFSVFAWEKARRNAEVERSKAIGEFFGWMFRRTTTHPVRLPVNTGVANSDVAPAVSVSS